MSMIRSKKVIMKLVVVKTLGRISKESTKIKISQKLKNKPKSKEHIEKMASTRKGKVPSEESLKKRSESMKKTLAIKKQLMQNL